MRATAKRLIELALVHGGVASFARSRRVGQVLVLAYHNVVPDGERRCGDRSLHLAQRDFAAQLDTLSTTHDVVPLADALGEAPAHGARPRAAITFDDAYHGALTAGVAELVRRGLPATIFVPPSFVGGRTFWWDEVAEARGALDPGLRQFLLTELRGEDARVREWLGGTDDALPAHAHCVDEQELGRAASTSGISLGSHTWSHLNLATLHGEELDRELRRPVQWLRERFANTLPVLSFPYGIESDEARRAARDAGYRAAMLISGGWMRRDVQDPFALPRLDVPAALSVAGFRLRTAGVIGG